MPAGQAGQSKSPPGSGRVPRRPGALLPGRPQVRRLASPWRERGTSSRASAAGAAPPHCILVDFLENPLELVRTSR